MEKAVSPDGIQPIEDLDVCQRKKFNSGADLKIKVYG